MLTGRLASKRAVCGADRRRQRIPSPWFWLSLAVRAGWACVAGMAGF